MVSSQIRNYLIALVIISVICTILHYWNLPSPPHTIALKRDVLLLSEKYVAALAKEQKELIDSPYNGHDTKYDMKKTMAVLLDDLMTRMDDLETKYAHLLKVQPSLLYQEPGSNKSVNFLSLLKGSQEVCHLSASAKVEYPDCDSKIEWMSKHWKSDACYAKMGVDGSMCSFVFYLSEVEKFCPILPIRQQILLEKEQILVTAMNLHLTGLMRALQPISGNQHHFLFLRNRISNLWPEWVRAAQRWQQQLELTASGKRNTTLSHIPFPYKRRKILIHLGQLTGESHTDGGPSLSELVQWSDVIASYYILGHELIISAQVTALESFLKSFPMSASPCQAFSRVIVDLMVTDVVGLQQIEQRLSSLFVKLKCSLRVISPHGTQPKFNHAGYAKAANIITNNGVKMLQPKQFYTLFPHTEENTFLGFVVPPSSSHRSSMSKDDVVIGTSSQRNKPLAVIYGNHVSSWKGARAYLDLLHEFFHLYATVVDAKPGDIPDYVTNLGLLTATQYFRLLNNATVFVGLGSPYEGVAPLEAISRGVIFLNPRFQPPLNRGSTLELREWTTERQLTSQHPFIETHVAPPRSYLVDMDNLNSVRDILITILSQPLAKMSPVPVPEEFTALGMLRRVTRLVEQQEMCSLTGSVTSAMISSEMDGLGLARVASRFMPPISTTEFVVGVLGDSCSRTCARRNRTCEPLHFPWINRLVEIQERGIICAQVFYRLHPIAPAIYPRSDPYPSPVGREFACVFNTEPLLFSCNEQSKDYARLCACRDPTWDS